MAFTRGLADANIWRARLPNGHSAVTSEPLLASTRVELAPQYAPDGRHIAFASDRSGNTEIWLADSRGGNPVQLTELGFDAGSPRWSPDSRSVVFDCHVSGHWNIFRAAVDGGTPKRITDDASDAVIPSYSRDGKWIYFASRRTGRYEIWKVPANGGKAGQVTRNGGFVSFESMDGKWLYYTRSEESPSLWKVPSTGGQESSVLPEVVSRAFFPTEQGIYFIDQSSSNNCSIRLLSFGSGSPKELLRLSKSPGLGLTVSPDGQFLLYSQWDQFGSDLMMIENFR